MYLYKVKYTYDNNNEGFVLVVAENKREALEKVPINKFGCKLSTEKLNVIDGYRIKLEKNTRPDNIIQMMKWSKKKDRYETYFVGDCYNCGNKVNSDHDQCPECKSELRW